MNNIAKPSQLCQEVAQFNKELERLARIASHCDKVMGDEQWYKDKHKQEQGTVSSESDYELLLDENGGEL